ncbi:DUF4347 domain-containing protein [Neorhodopirellula lusitana]
MKRSLLRRLISTSDSKNTAKSSHVARRRNDWALSPLEPRLMLAGDAGAEVGAAAAAGGVAEGGVGHTQQGSGTVAADQAAGAGAVAEMQITEIAFVDSEIQDESQITGLIRRGVELVLIDSTSSPLQQIDAAIRARGNVSAIHVLSHGQSGQVQLGGQIIDRASLESFAGAIQGWANHLTEDADILIYGCEVAAGTEGGEFLQVLAKLSGADVAGSTDATGASRLGGDWNFELATGSIETDLIASIENLQRVDMVLPITIRAAGTTGEEQMQLEINGNIVQTWNNIGGDAQDREFVTYTYNGGDDATPGDIRIWFTNDLFIPSEGFDRNLRIDSVTVNFTTIEAEDPTTFGTGTWLDADGTTPGYRQNEWIHSNGYFEFADPPSQGSTLSIYAAGDENSEQMQLWIDGTLANTWNNIGGNARSNEFVRYDFSTSEQVDISDVRVRFSNDLYLNGGELDRNLRVEQVVLDGTTYETEASDVYSTGTWKDGGVTPGFKQEEWLHSNGYFQFGASSVNPGTIALQTSNVSVDEDAGTATVNVIRSGSSDGIVTVDYDTFAGTATEGSDYVRQTGTLTFADGETNKSIVVPIINDSQSEGNEAFNITIDNVGGGANLLVPRTATISIIDDESDLPSYANFSNVTGLDLNGDARQTGSLLELTTTGANLAGSAFYETPIDLTGDGSFRSSFSFQTTGGTTGADGWTFTIQNDPRGTAALGGTGSLLGYEGITQSIAVEFDTYAGAGDINNNHVSILAGAVDFNLRTAIPDFDLNSGSPVYAWVDYNGTSNVLAVYVSQTNSRPTEALLKTTVDLQSQVGNTGYVGFTAATGGAQNSHRIRNWELDLSTPPTDPPVVGGDELISVTVASGLSNPIAIEWLPDGTMLIAEQGGVVKTAANGNVSATPFIDISSIVNGVRDRGLMDIAVHPDFENNPYVYLLFTYDPPEVYNQASGTLAGPDGKGNRAGRLIRVTADSSKGYLEAVAGSEVVLLGTNSTWDNFNGFANSTTNFNEAPAGENPDGSFLNDFINSDSESHTVGALAFGIDGNLFVSIGDGASYNRVDPRADRVQDIDSLNGKVLRIDPLTGQGLSDNPFYNGNAGDNRSKVYQLGLRNPFRMSVDPVTGRLFVGDVGWTQWEEINSAGAGANFGWPFYEGGSGTSVINQGYANTAEGQAFFAQSVAVTASQYALNHQADGINAIVMGDVYRGTLYGSEYEGDVFFNDLGQGIVRHADVGPNGELTNVQTFTTGSSVVVAISQGPDGALYYVDLNDSTVARWELV